MYLKGLGLSLMSSVALAGVQIHETKNLSEFILAQKKGPETCFIVDIDETLITHAQYLGSGSYFSKSISSIPKDPNFEINYNIALSNFYAVDAATDFKLLEKHLPSMLDTVTRSGGLVFGLTARNYIRTSIYTIERLSNLGFKFATDTNLPEAPLWEGGPKAHGGVYFDQLDKIDKAKAIERILEIPPFRHKCKVIYFFDDKLSYHNDIFNRLGKRTDIEIHSVYYSHPHLANHPQIEAIGQIQLDIFLSTGRLIGDEEAIRLLDNKIELYH